MSRLLFEHLKVPTAAAGEGSGSHAAAEGAHNQNMHFLC